MLNTGNLKMRLALLLCALLILLSGAFYLFAKHGPQPSPYQQLGGAFSLHHLDGPVALADFSGKGVVMMFGYTSCPDVCPTGLATLAAALNRMSTEQQQQIQPLFISVDPERDTLEQLDQYSRYFFPSLLGITGSKAEVDRVVSAYGAFYRRVEMSGSALAYSVDHSARIYLIDRRGQLVNILNHNTPAAELARALQQLLQESS
ncbi:MAG: protein SCO1/2 [Motiliproteus sp.]|jgi:protein SCO1/2